MDKFPEHAKKVPIFSLYLLAGLFKKKNIETSSQLVNLQDID